MADNKPDPTPLRIGVCVEECQLADITGIDILGNLSKSMFDAVLPHYPSLSAFSPHARPIEFLFLASTLAPLNVTIGMKITPTVTYDDCPRDLDIVLIGGPWPTHRPESANRFFREAWESTPVWITTCTGAMWLAGSGVLDGLKATANRGFLKMAGGMYPGVEWVEQRWVVEEKKYVGSRNGGKGELWTSGGAQAGVDMIARFALAHWDKEYVEIMGLEGLDLDVESDRGQFYTKPQRLT